MNMPKSSSNQVSRSPSQVKPERDLALDRLIFFSDAVFAIAITLLALDIRLPALLPTATDAQLLNQLLGLGPKYYSYVLSFLTIGLYWLGHHRMFQYISRYDPLLLVLNLLLLMGIAFIPFASLVIGDYNDRTSDVFYALVLTLTGLLSGGMWLYASVGGRLLICELSRGSFRLILFRSFLPPTLFLFSAAFAFWNPSFARLLWYLIAVVTFINPMVFMRKAAPHGST
jgi:uncharacterized membrane protein